MIRLYEPSRDQEALLRIFQEIGWLSDPAVRGTVFTQIAELCRTLVWDIDGVPEALAASTYGEMMYLDAPIPMSNIEFVATSRIARHGGVAARLTAESIARDVLERGSPINTLGMFDQGYYDRVGFGAGHPQTILTVDPADLDVPPMRRSAVRLDTNDWERMFANRRRRYRPHGTVTMLDPRLSKAAATSSDVRSYFGLGFEDPASGELTHHIWFRTEATGSGPYAVFWWAFQTREQMIELLSLLRSLSDQVMLVRIPQPGGLQLQDFIRRPFRHRTRNRGGSFGIEYENLAWWQLRMNDIEACLARTRLPWVREPLTFELHLSDPITRWLSDETRSAWSGAGGRYLVTLGPESHAERVSAAPDDEGEAGPMTGQPRLRTSVNTFSRLWLGVQSPRGLAMTAADLADGADPGLIDDLDAVLRLPAPQVDWPL